jgi:hypothetical protein
MASGKRVIGSGCELREFYRVGGQGSIPQPHQKLTSVDGSEAGSRSVVGAEVIPEGMVLCCLAGSAPANAPVIISAVQEQGREGGEGHQRVSGELRVL